MFKITLKPRFINRAALPLALTLFIVAGSVPFAAQADHTTAHTIAQITAQIASLQAQINALLGQSNDLPITCAFNRNLYLGLAGEDVRCLQKFLNYSGYKVADSGAGSPGNETIYYGPRTRAAVINWQRDQGFASIIGFFGPLSQARYQTLAVVTPLPGTPDTGGPAPTTPPPATPASGLTVSLSPNQPNTVLAPQGAARVPFLRLNLSASSNGDAIVRSITAERRGLASNAVFDGLVLIDDETGLQIGLAKTLNSNNQTIFNEPLTVRAGTTKTITLAGNMASSLAAYQGQVPGLAVIAVDAGSTAINGTLPMVSAGVNINSTLSIGTLSAARGFSDPGISQTKEVGQTDLAFAAIRITAGSAEDVSLEAVRWNQAGSVSASDLASVRVKIDGTAYSTAISSDGKYYSAKFSPAISITKGSAKEIAITGDTVSGSNRTVSFDILRKTDIVARGTTFGYYITASGGSAGAAAEGSLSSTQEPFYNGYTLTLAQGSLRVDKSNAVTAGNVTEETLNTPLGSFTLEAKGEPIQISQLPINFAVTGSGAATNISSVSLFDAAGNIVAGPKDVTSDTSITLTDAFTVPAGTQTYTVKGKLSLAFASGDTIVVSINPSNITARGQNTGIAVTATPSTAILANTQTVRASSLAVSVSPSPAAQSVIAGTSGFAFARYQLDASASGEDVQITSLRPRDTYGGSPGANDLNSCQLFDSSTPLTTGGNTVNPSLDGSSPDDFVFRMDNPLIVTKGTFKTIELKCNIASRAVNTSTHAWGINSGLSDTVAGAGRSTNNSITATVTTGIGQTMTMGTQGTVAVTLDPSTPPQRWGLAGKTDVVMAYLRVQVGSEAIRLDKVGLVLNGSGASAADISKVTLWDVNTKVGETLFVGNTTAVSAQLSGNFIVPKNESKILTVKTDLAPVGTNQPGTTGHQIAVNYDGATVANTGAIGQSSGVTIQPAVSANTTAQGVRLAKTELELEQLSLPTNTLANGGNVLYRFKVAANSMGDVGLYKLTFKTAATSATLSNFSVYGYTDANFSISAYASNPLNQTTVATADGSGFVEIYFNPVSDGSNEAIQIPAGATRFFELRASASGVASGSSVSINLEGDGAYLTSGFVNTAANVDADANDDFIWSPNTTTIASPATSDWVNGFLVLGLPTTGTSAQILSR